MRGRVHPHSHRHQLLLLRLVVVFASLLLLSLPTAWYHRRRYQMLTAAPYHHYPTTHRVWFATAQPPQQPKCLSVNTMVDEPEICGTPSVVDAQGVTDCFANRSDVEPCSSRGYCLRSSVGFSTALDCVCSEDRFTQKCEPDTVQSYTQAFIVTSSGEHSPPTALPLNTVSGMTRQQEGSLVATAATSGQVETQWPVDAATGSVLPIPTPDNAGGGGSRTLLFATVSPLIGYLGLPLANLAVGVSVVSVTRRPLIDRPGAGVVGSYGVAPLLINTSTAGGLPDTGVTYDTPTNDFAWRTPGEVSLTRRDSVSSKTARPGYVSQPSALPLGRLPWPFRAVPDPTAWTNVGPPMPSAMMLPALPVIDDRLFPPTQVGTSDAMALPGQLRLGLSQGAMAPITLLPWRQAVFAAGFAPDVFLSPNSSSIGVPVLTPATHLFASFVNSTDTVVPRSISSSVLPPAPATAATYFSLSRPFWDSNASANLDPVYFDDNDDVFYPQNTLFMGQQQQLTPIPSTTTTATTTVRTRPSSQVISVHLLIGCARVVRFQDKRYRVMNVTLRSSALQSRTPLLENVAMAALMRQLLEHPVDGPLYEIAAYGNEAAVLYTPNGRQMICFSRGLTNIGRFGFSDLNEIIVNGVVKTFRPSGIYADENIASLHLGSTHAIVRTNKQRVFASGPARSTCLTTSTDQFVLVPSITVPGNRAGVTVVVQINGVLAVAAGDGFSVVFLDGGATGETKLISCGGDGVITGVSHGATQLQWAELLVVGVYNWTRPRLCAGTAYACAISDNGYTKCWGSQGGVTQRSSPFICQVRSSADFTSAIYQALSFNATSVSCGSHHVVWVETVNAAVTHRAVSPFEPIVPMRKIYACGANDKGQLGIRTNDPYVQPGFIATGVGSSASFAPNVVTPIFTMPLGFVNGFAVTSMVTSVPYSAGVLNAPNDELSNLATLPLFEVQTVFAMQNTTFVTATPRVFPTPAALQASYAAALQQLPPDAWYRFSPVSFGDPLPYRVLFTVVPGMALLVLSNQSRRLNDWLTAPQDPLSCYATTTTSSGVVTPMLSKYNAMACGERALNSMSSQNFLTRVNTLRTARFPLNDSDAILQPLFEPTSQSYFRFAGPLVQRLHCLTPVGDNLVDVTLVWKTLKYFVQDSDGRLWNVSALSPCPWAIDVNPANASDIVAVNAWCDLDLKVVVWSSPGQRSNLAAGFIDLLQSTTAWVSLLAQIVTEQTTFTQAVGRPMTFDLSSVAPSVAALNDSALLANVTTGATESNVRAWVDFLSRFQRQASSMAAGAICEPTTSAADCSSAVWVETFREPTAANMDSFARSTIHSVPWGGVQLQPLGVVASSPSNWLAFLPPVWNSRSVQRPPVLRRPLFQTGMGLTLVCILAKIGTRMFDIMLLPNGRIVHCGGGVTRGTPYNGFSQGRLGGFTITASNYSGLAAVNQSYFDPTYKPPPATWAFLTDNILQLLNVDISGRLAFSSNRLTRYNVSDVTFQLSCAGGYRVAVNNVTFAITLTDPSSYLLFTNESIATLGSADARWFLRDATVAPLAAPFVVGAPLITRRATTPNGCHGGIWLPAPRGTVSVDEIYFHLSVASAPGKLDGVVSGDVTILTPSFATLNGGARFAFSFERDGVRVLDVSRGWQSPSAAGVGLTDVTIATCDVARSDVPYRRAPLVNEFAIVHNGVASVSSLYLNNRLACRSTTMFMNMHLQNVLGVNVAVINREGPISGGTKIREVVFCNSPATAATSKAINRLPCRFGGKTYHITQPRTTTRSVAVTLTKTVKTSPSPTVTLSLTTSISVSPTPSRGSGSTTATTTISPSVSRSQLTASSTFTPRISPSVSLTSSVTPSFSEVKTRSLVFERGLSSETISSTLVRRSGIVIRLSVANAYFSFFRDWFNRTSGMLMINTTSSIEDNPYGFQAVYRYEGFARGEVNSLNYSQLVLHFGPFSGYTSIRDEVVTLSLTNLGYASELPSPNNISFVINGTGPIMTEQIVVVESIGGALAILAVIVGAPSNTALLAASNTVLLNYQCFNKEQTTRSFLFNPFFWELAGSYDLGGSVACMIVICSLMIVHLIVVVVIYLQRRRRRQLHYLKGLGLGRFPGLFFTLSLVFMPGMLMGSWRFGINATGIAFAVPVITSTISLAPLWYLYSVLYDESNFTAQWIPVSNHIILLRRVARPVRSFFQADGRYESTDRYFSFVQRLGHCFVHHTERRRYYFCLELVAVMFECLLLAVSNSSTLICMVQTMIALALRGVMLALLFKFRPYNLRASLYGSAAVQLFQLLAALMFFLYVAQDMTNSSRTATTVLLLVSVTVTLCHTATFLPATLWQLFEVYRMRRTLMLRGKAPKIPISEDHIGLGADQARQSDDDDESGEHRDMELLEGEELQAEGEAAKAKHNGFKPKQDMDFRNDASDEDNNNLLDRRLAPGAAGMELLPPRSVGLHFDGEEMQSLPTPSLLFAPSPNAGGSSASDGGAQAMVSSSGAVSPPRVPFSLAKKTKTALELALLEEVYNKRVTDVDTTKLPCDQIGATAVKTRQRSTSFMPTAGAARNANNNSENRSGGGPQSPAFSAVNPLQDVSSSFATDPLLHSPPTAKAATRPPSDNGGDHGGGMMSRIGGASSGVEDDL